MNPVLILGAGINGAAVARELVLNRVPVILVDRNDIAFGATSRSSRLIHGGLRYLEYRDFELVRESLVERERLLRTAPHFVQPLRLAIPVKQRFGGLLAGAAKFMGMPGLSWAGSLSAASSPRGLWAVRCGLSIYDWLAGDSSLPKHSVTELPGYAGWVCEFSDAQMIYPERFVLALLRDAEMTARQTEVRFEVHPHCEVQRTGNEVSLRLQRGASNANLHQEPFTPSLIINATGAWGDRTLHDLGHSGPPLFAGTKGSHLFTHCERLKTALQNRGIYAEARDGRLIFILPCGDGVLIGTTDEPFHAAPESAIATQADVAYLVQLVNDVLPHVQLRIDEVEMHHAGVRPLPNVSAKSTSAIPRGHSIHETNIDAVSVITLVGGKLTTCRALAADVADRILPRLGITRSVETTDRPVPGAVGIPSALPHRTEFVLKLAAKKGLTTEQARCVFELIGNRFDEIWPEDHSVDSESRHEPRASLPATSIPLDFIRWVIRSEWCYTLEDLVERRLLLTFAVGLKRSTLRTLARLLVEEGCITMTELDAQVEADVQRLKVMFGKKVEDDG